MPISAGRVSLLRWLRRQLAQPGTPREHLEAAAAHDDAREARRALARVPFSREQRRHLDRLLDDWERETAGSAGAADDRDAPRGA